MHGACAGAPAGPRNGRYRDGLYEREHVDQRRYGAALLAALKALTDYPRR